MIAVVIPCFKTRNSVLEVLKQIGKEVGRIYVVDDACPEKTGDWVKSQCLDPRVVVLKSPTNLGVGGATLIGFRQAIADGVRIVVKLDSDGQMDPREIPIITRPILEGWADVAKGNRFFDLRTLRSMPILRLIGNSALSFINKLVSGYWNVMDPTNGYIALHVGVLKQVPLDQISPRYFFESDLLFRLGTIRATVIDVPMPARYLGEKSSLRISKVLIEFPPKYLIRFVKRILYQYFIRDFNIGSLYILAALLLLPAGVIFGIERWVDGVRHGVAATSGVVMLAGLPVLLGCQALFAAMMFDVANLPKDPLQKWILE